MSDAMQALRGIGVEVKGVGRENCDCASCQDMRVRLDAALAAVEAEMARLREDSRRLDWAQEHYGGADFAFDAGGDEPICMVYIEIPKSARINADLRYSIDAARAAEEDSNAP